MTKGPLGTGKEVIVEFFSGEDSMGRRHFSLVWQSERGRRGQHFFARLRDYIRPIRKAGQRVIIQKSKGVPCSPTNRRNPNPSS